MNENAMRQSIDAIKAELHSNIKTEQPKCVIRPRQTGKTTALLEFIHEYCSGFCYLVTIDERICYALGRQYKQMFPDDEQPMFVSFRSLLHLGLGREGRPRVWASDEVWPVVVEERSGMLKQCVYIGGVGSPISMDIHSR